MQLHEELEHLSTSMSKPGLRAPPPGHKRDCKANSKEENQRIEKEIL
jgi:hypothetical protein